MPTSRPAMLGDLSRLRHRPRCRPGGTAPRPRRRPAMLGDLKSPAPQAAMPTRGHEPPDPGGRPAMLGDLKSPAPQAAMPTRGHEPPGPRWPTRHAWRPQVACATGRDANPGERAPRPRWPAHYAWRPAVARGTGRDASPGARAPGSLGHRNRSGSSASARSGLPGSRGAPADPAGAGHCPILWRSGYAGFPIRPRPTTPRFRTARGQSCWAAAHPRTRAARAVPPSLPSRCRARSLAGRAGSPRCWRRPWLARARRARWCRGPPRWPACTSRASARSLRPGSVPGCAGWSPTIRPRT